MVKQGYISHQGNRASQVRVKGGQERGSIGGVSEGSQVRGARKGGGVVVTSIHRQGLR